MIKALRWLLNWLLDKVDKNELGWPLIIVLVSLWGPTIWNVFSRWRSRKQVEGLYERIIKDRDVLITELRARVERLEKDLKQAYRRQRGGP